MGSGQDEPVWRNDDAAGSAVAVTQDDKRLANAAQVLLHGFLHLHQRRNVKSRGRSHLCQTGQTHCQKRPRYERQEARQVGK